MGKSRERPEKRVLSLGPVPTHFRRANAERRAERLPQVEAERDAEKARADAATAKRDAAIEKLRQDKLQTARNLKAMKLTNEQIAAATGLSAADIEKL